MMSLDKPIITSILDNDFYKFTMQHGVIKLFPHARAKYCFINRGEHTFPEGFAERLRSAVNELAHLRLSKAEKAYLTHTCPYFDPTYLDFLQGYSFNPEEVHIAQRGTELDVRIEGYWYRTILWEVPLMAIICELYYEMTGQKRNTDEEIVTANREKILAYKELGLTIAEFGTRRRHSYHVHNVVVDALNKYGTGTFVGTSNVHLAMKYQTRPIGTHAHEWFMFHAAKYGYKMANLLGLEHWTSVYRGDLGIALTDTYTSEIFFEQFDKKFSKLFDGIRHDSGDPLVFIDKAVAHYQKMGIDPTTKTIIFSDALNYEKVRRIAEYNRGKIGMSFGIGTNFTNDVGLAPMNIVIKMTETMPENRDWMPVVKLSDDKGKHTGIENMISLAKEILNIE